MNDSFKIEDDYKEKKKIVSNKSLLIAIGIILLIIIIILLIMLIRHLKYGINVNKINSDKPYVYTVAKYENTYEDDEYYEVPIINLSDDKYTKINKAILDNYQSVSTKLHYDYSYKYNRTKNILSLLITYAYYENEIPVRYFETINIDLNKNKILTKSDILKKYNLDNNKINLFMESKFKSFYTDLIKKEYYTSNECDYNCFLKNRMITNNYTDGLAYYLSGKSLIGYKYFNFSSSYGEEDYFLNNDYEFVIKK